MVDENSENDVPTLIKDGILNEPMLMLLQRAILGNVSILVAAQHQKALNLFWEALAQSLERLGHTGFMLCELDASQTTSELSSRILHLGRIVLGNLSIEKLTTFQKLGTLMMYPVTSSANSYAFLQAALRGHTIAFTVAPTFSDALQSMQRGICQQLPQVTEAIAGDWLRQHVPLALELIQDPVGKLHLNMIDLGNSSEQ